MARRQGSRRGERPIEWNFFSFPVALGVAAGALGGVLLATFIGPGLVFMAALFGVSFGVAHIIGHTWRRRRLENSLERAEEDERERRILAARAAAQREASAEQAPPARRRRRRRA